MVKKILNSIKEFVLWLYTTIMCIAFLILTFAFIILIPLVSVALAIWIYKAIF